MVTMSTSGQTGVANRPSTVSGSIIDAGPSAANSVLECQNINNCHQNSSSFNNNSEDFSDWKNLLHDSSKMNKFSDIVENSSSASNKCVVDSLLQQINQLSDVEKFLLYLKLPVGKSQDLDPLKQPLNPLGSRREIQFTITWMKTHLKLDLEVSLPKDEVYNEYLNYSNNNGFKALSTADFGKVMKQVFKDVRARRLGQRGSSKYCHSGLRKTIVTDPPTLPDLSLNNSSINFTKRNGFNHDVSIDERDQAASIIIYEWAEKTLKIKLDNLRDLALYLIDKNLVDNRSGAALTLHSSVDQNQRSGTGKHRETNMQLHKKIQERQDREHNRKRQEQMPGSLKSGSDRIKTRRKSGNVRNSSGDSKNSRNHSEPRLMNQNGSFECETNNNLSNEAVDNKKRNCIKQEVCPPGSGSLVQYNNSLMDSKDQNLINNNDNRSSNQLVMRTNSFESKPVSPKSCLMSNTIASQASANKNRYKPIQPKGENNNNLITDANTKSFLGTPVSSSLGESNLVDMVPNVDDNRPLLTQDDDRNVFNNINKGDSGDDISQLKILLQANLPNSGANMGLQTSFFEPQSPGILSEQDIAVGTNRLRRVSFIDGTINSNNAMGLNYPAERQRTLLAPVTTNGGTNYSPMNTVNYPPFSSQGPSHTSSANASPFISPRTTPLNRSRHNSGQQTYVRSNSFTPDKNSQFQSTALTPYSRPRPNSSQYMRTTPARTRNPSGATASFRHTPYPEDNRRSKSRHSSGSISIPPSPQSAPLSPLIQESTNCPLGVGDPPLYQNTFKPYPHIGDFRRRHMSDNTTIHYHPPQSSLTYNNPPLLNLNNDLEVSNMMTNATGLTVNQLAINRPQSVPLPQMMAVNSELEAKSHPTTPLNNQQFHFGPECYQSSISSSITATPVPSEINDFDLDQVLETGDTDGRSYCLDGINSIFPSDIVNTLSGVASDSPIMISSYTTSSDQHAPLTCVNVTSSNKMDHQSDPLVHHHPSDTSNSHNMTLNAINTSNVFITSENIIETPTSHLVDEFQTSFNLETQDFLESLVP